MIYKAELDIKEQIFANSKAEFLCDLTPAKHLVVQPFGETAIAKLEAALANTRDKFDLYPIHTILVSTGLNKNDDYFDKAEIWEARHSPEDKPFNLEHQPRQIIGHMTANYVVDDNYEVIADDSAFEDIPDKIHILTSAVIYRHLRKKDKELTEAIADLIDEIEDGQWCVSMECLFSDFGYLLSSEGKTEIVKRNEDTAYLTKHLRIYGGDGTYNGKSVARVLRNITFTGKGLTRKPANPDSVILHDRALASEFSPPELIFIGANTNMADNDKTIEQANARIKELEERLASLEEAKVKAAMDELQAKVDASAAEVASMKEQLEQAEKKAVELETSKASVETKLAETEKILGDMKAEATKVARISILVDKKMDRAEAEKIVEKFAMLDDEHFSELASIIEPKVVEAEQTTETETETEDKPGEAAAQEEVLKETETVEEDKAALASDVKPEEDEVAEARAHLSGYFSNVLKTSKNRK